jgi:hypothetical protein
VVYLVLPSHTQNGFLSISKYLFSTFQQNQLIQKELRREAIRFPVFPSAHCAHCAVAHRHIVTANSSPLGCVGNVLLDIQIDRGKHLTIDALLVENESYNCFIAWKDMQRAGIISLSFPAKVHSTKVAPAVVDRRVEVKSEPNMAIKCVKVTNMPLCAVPNAEVKRVNMTDRPKCSVPSRGIENVSI